MRSFQGAMASNEKLQTNKDQKREGGRSSTNMVSRGGMKVSQARERRVHDEGGNLLHRLRADSVVDLL